MSRYTTITVIQDDIDKAMTRQSARCVVATAIARSIPGASKVAIDLQAVRFTLDGERHVYFTPPSAAGYVIAFDAGDPIEPFRFRLSEDHRLPATPNRPRTEAGLQRERARNATRKPKADIARAEQALATATTPAQREVAEDIRAEAAARLAQAEAKRVEIEARTAGQPTQAPKTRANMPTTFKRGSRHYGHRELRVNQADVLPEARANLLSAYTAETGITHQ